MHFDIVSEVECKNVYNIEEFKVMTDMYVAVSNYANEYGKLIVKNNIHMYVCMGFYITLLGIRPKFV